MKRSYKSSSKKFSPQTDEQYFSQLFPSSHSSSNNYYSHSYYLSHYNKYNHPPTPKPLTPSQRFHTYLSKIPSTMLIPEHTTDLITILHQNKLECVICNELITPRHSIWSCTKCYTIIHLTCITEWIKQQTGEHHQPPSNTSNNKKQQQQLQLLFKCPHCKHDYNLPEYPVYDCYCKKYYSALEKRNKHMDTELIPHGCGLYCNHAVCKHIQRCPLPCHPGPHVQCRIIEDINCYCGKSSKKVPCTIDMEDGFSCGNICNKKLNCGKPDHTCKAICHEGSCEQFLKKGKCYNCIAESKHKLFTFLQELQTKLKHECYEARHLTTFAQALTDYIFNGVYPCGEHITETKTETNLKFLLRLMQISGDKLLDNIKTFIPICQTQVNNNCNCKTKTSITECFKLNYPEDLLDFIGVVKEKEQEQCTKVCKTLKNCKIHKCERICCELRDVRIKNYSTEDPYGYHLCMLLCNKALPCGLHKCENYCHKGACKPCAYIIHDEVLYCTCKKTKLEPPYVCGSKVECQFMCSRPRTCEHPCTLTCHDGACPPCEELTFKHCRCKRTVINDVKCGNHNELLCTTKCDAMLPCGVHFCELKCHVHTEEYDNNYECAMICGRQLNMCEHVCQMKCHGESECDEYACDKTVTVLCKCGTTSKVFKCGLYKQKDKTDIKVECNDECIRKQRLRNIEKAFKGLKAISEEKMKLLYPNYTAEGVDELKKETPGKYDWDTLSKALNKIDVVMKFEEVLYKKIFAAKNEMDLPIIPPSSSSSTASTQEHTVKQITSNNKDIKIQIDDDDDYEMICEWLILYHSVNPVKKISKKTNNTYLTITFEALKHFHYQKHRLSLIALLLKYNLFAEKKKITVHHPFNYSILIRNHKSTLTYDTLEMNIVDHVHINKNDFYVNEYAPKEFYVHFYDETTGEKVYRYMQMHTFEYNEVYNIVYDVKREIKKEDLYSYYTDVHYFNYLYDGYNAEYANRKKNEIQMQNENEVDEDGFTVVKKKK